MTMPVLRACRIVEVLQGVGFQENQAQAVASLIRRSRGLDQSFITREDLVGSIDSFEQRMIARFALFEQRMTIRLGLMLFAAAGLALAAAKFL